MITPSRETYHVEPVETSRSERERLLAGVRRLLGERRVAARGRRREQFNPDLSSPAAYASSLAGHRARLVEMLGWPLTEAAPPVEGRMAPVAEDEHGSISRVHVRTVGGLTAYALLFLPRAAGRHPLVIAQHGGHGAPELAAGFWPEAPSNYNGMISRLRRRGVAVLAPQLLVWDKGQEPAFDQNHLDRQFRHLGGSRAAFDLCQMRDLLAWTLTRPEIDCGRLGVTGLSYGGFYSLFFAALDPRMRVVVSSCFVNDRHHYDWEDWVWTGSALNLLDGEVAQMICPRPLFLESGVRDELFAAEGFDPVAREVAANYKTLGLDDRFEARLHDGGHEYDPDARATEFLLRWL